MKTKRHLLPGEVVPPMISGHSSVESLAFSSSRRAWKTAAGATEVSVEAWRRRATAWVVSLLLAWEEVVCSAEEARGLHVVRLRVGALFEIGRCWWEIRFVEVMAKGRGWLAVNIADLIMFRRQSRKKWLSFFSVNVVKTCLPDLAL